MYRDCNNYITSPRTKYLLNLVVRVCAGLEPSVYMEQARRQILPVLRLVQQGPEDHVARENPGGKKADKCN